MSSCRTVTASPALVSWDVHGHFWRPASPISFLTTLGRAKGLPTPPWPRPQLLCSLPLRAPVTKGRAFSQSQRCKGALTKSFSSLPSCPFPDLQTQQDSLRQAAGKRWALLRGLPAVPMLIPLTTGMGGGSTSPSTTGQLGALQSNPLDRYHPQQPPGCRELGHEQTLWFISSEAGLGHTAPFPRASSREGWVLLGWMGAAARLCCL